MKKYSLILCLLIGTALVGTFLLFSKNNTLSPKTEEAAPLHGENLESIQYLMFQIFTRTTDSSTLRQNFPPSKSVAATVDDIIRAIGNNSSEKRRLGFIPGPLSFDSTDDQIQQLIRDSFALALEKNIAVGFHIDDSMFWERLSYLNTIENIEWMDWNKTPNTGRRLDWSSTPTKIMPQLCLNSPAVKYAVKERATLIGKEIEHGIETLQKAGKAELFAGVIAGWETQMGRDFATAQSLGYCALTNKGYSATNKPLDIDQARAEVIKDFIDFWASSLANAGVPDGKIFSHIAFLSQSTYDAAKFSDPNRLPGTYLQTVNFTPPAVSFGSHHFAGLSTYPQSGMMEQFQAERARNGNPPWASAEGTAIDPSAAERGEAGGSMEPYLGTLFNHGAVVVNIFGWGVGDASNPFRKTAENASAITAYQKFLRGEILKEHFPVQIPSSQFYFKVSGLQQELPSYFSKNGDGGEVGRLYKTFTKQVDAQQFTDAEKTIDALLKIIGK